MTERISDCAKIRLLLDAEQDPTLSIGTMRPCIECLGSAVLQPSIARPEVNVPVCADASGDMSRGTCVLPDNGSLAPGPLSASEEALLNLVLEVSRQPLETSSKA
ncbi:MAG TPA: hypothetical protein VLI54_06765 [Bacillota bacterium]|nr:hypothetical protein [Bacillota bacterium]